MHERHLKQHVDFSVETLSQYHHLDDRVIRIVRSHHERHDGHGFPKGLRGDQIPTLARFAILAYCFERLLRTNDNRRGVSPARAMARLYKQRELKFPEQLVVEFIHVLGMYPVGTVVELSSGERALVLEQNQKDRLHPRIALITDEFHKLLDTPRVVDLAAEAEGGSVRAIAGNVNPDRLDVDLADYTFRFCGKRIALGPLGFRL